MIVFLCLLSPLFGKFLVFNVCIYLCLSVYSCISLAYLRFGVVPRTPLFFIFFAKTNELRLIRIGRKCKVTIFLFCYVNIQLVICNLTLSLSIHNIDTNRNYSNPYYSCTTHSQNVSCEIIVYVHVKIY